MGGGASKEGDKYKEDEDVAEEEEGIGALPPTRGGGGGGGGGGDGGGRAGRSFKSKARQSVVFDNPKAQSLVPSMVTMTEPDVYQIRVPAGSPPGSTFGAICGKRYVKVEVPEDCVAGDVIEVDLRDENTPGPSPKPGAATGSGAGGVDMRGAGRGGGPAGGIDTSENLKECARLFIKYGAAETYKLSLSALEKILENEFSFAPGSENIKRELMMVDIDRSNIITFQEFVIWYDHIKLRMQVEKLMRDRAAEQEAASKRREEELRHENAAAASAAETDAAEKAEVERLRAEHEALSKQMESQKSEFARELAALKAEKDRLNKEKLGHKDASLKLDQTDQRINLLETTSKSNETMIKQMKEEYEALQERQQHQLTLAKEEQRRKLEAKLRAQKNQGAAGAPRQEPELSPP